MLIQECLGLIQLSSMYCLRQFRYIVVLFTVLSVAFPAVAAPDFTVSKAPYWKLVGSLHTASFRGGTLIVLPNGMALVTGGYGYRAPISDAELYDPHTGQWQRTSAMEIARSFHTATLLQTGKVLVAGGIGIGTNSNTVALSSAELYDPVSGRWKSTRPMARARSGHTATLLADGRVLVTGGDATDPTSCEIFDPRTNTWHATGHMVVARTGQVAVPLQNGDVLVVGGEGVVRGGTSAGDSLNSAELYNSRTGKWSITGSMLTPLDSLNATVLRSGQVLVTGDIYQPLGCTLLGGKCPVQTDAELYDAHRRIWRRAGQMVIMRGNDTATLLTDGRVLVAGGSGGSCGPSNCEALASAEIYNPQADTWTETASMQQSRVAHHAVLLKDGSVLVAGGNDGTNAVMRAEIYHP